MIGGIVTEALIVASSDEDRKIWINCGGTGVEEGMECAIYVEYDQVSSLVSEGDSVWWQGEWAYWTPAHARKRGECWDFWLRRWGTSGAPRPAEEDVEVAYA